MIDMKYTLIILFGVFVLSGIISILALIGAGSKHRKTDDIHE